MAKRTLIQVEKAEAGCPVKLTKNIHQTLVALDSELGVASDRRYRQRLVKAAYTLRDLEDWIQRDR